MGPISFQWADCSQDLHIIETFPYVLVIIHGLPQSSTFRNLIECHFSSNKDLSICLFHFCDGILIPILSIIILLKIILRQSGGQLIWIFHGNYFLSIPIHFDHLVKLNRHTTFNKILYANTAYWILKIEAHIVYILFRLLITWTVNEFDGVIKSVRICHG